MATPTLTTTNFSRINACDSMTDWGNIGGGAGAGLNADIVIQGNYSISRRVDNTTSGFAYDMGTTNTREFVAPFSGDGANQGEHIFFWVNILQPEAVNSFNLRLAGTATTGPPTTSDRCLDHEIFPANTYNGGWYRVAIDPTADWTALYGTGVNPYVVLSTCRWLGFVFSIADVGGVAENCIIDAIDIGRGLIVTGGSTTDKITWADIYAVSSSNTNAFGLIEERSGVFFMKGEWQFGDASNNCYFEDYDQIVVWENDVTDNGGTTDNIITGVSPDLNALIVVEGTGTTDFINGAKVGTGNDATGSNGIIYQAGPAVEGNRVNLRFDFSDSDITNVELYGCTFRNVLADGLTDVSIAFCDDATNGPNHEVSGCTFDQCGLVDLGRVSAQNLVFSNTIQSSKFGVPLDSVQHWDDSASTWYDVTSSVQSRDSGRFEYTSGSADVDADEVYFGLRDQFAGIQYVCNDLGDIGTNVAWEYWDGTAWSSLSGLFNGYLFREASSSYYPTTGYYQYWTLPTDWEQTTINSSGPYYYVRGRLTSIDSGGGGDHGDMFWIHAWTPLNGAALLWNDNIDLVNAVFSNNEDGDTNEKAHGVEHRDSGTCAYTAWTFSDNDADILFSAATGDLTINANNGSDPSTSTVLGTGSVTINTNVTVTLTGLIGSPPTEVRVYDTGTTTELTGQENVTTGSFAINLDASDYVDIRIHNVEYEYISFINFDMPATDTSIPIQQRFDRNYENP